ncbi:LCP family protein [Saccharopolyspora indica]|uniref:LCP family protein n=1 Tax=Saccharopolyspora indica TaxID=1229659 RepID=UPI0022EB0DE1|nr:LCP family protein [Saccharopolyspora indica]MDA3645159.1 LCP family protein [Saccharopolyspora indica]
MTDGDRPGFERDDRTMPIGRVAPGRRGWRAGARVAVALVSTAVFAFSGYLWSTLGRLQDGMSTSDVTTGAGPDGAVDILLVGLDGRTDAQGNALPEEMLRELRTGDSGSSLTDTLILLHIPEDRSRAVAYSLPRDSYVSIPDGHGQHKINSAYGRGKATARAELKDEGVSDPVELERRSNDAGRKLLVRTVEQLTGVAVDHYAEVNLLGFYQLTQAIGGVEVCLNNAVDDPLSGARFPAGHQMIDGGDALAFVRQRHGLPRGDLDRVQRQQAFMAGLAQSVLSTGTLTNPVKLNRMLDSVQQSVVLDEGLDVLSFAGQLQGLAGGSITFDTIPVEDPEYDTPGDGMAVKVNPRKVQLMIQRVNEGRPAEPPRPDSLNTSVVDVRNGAGIAGLASRVHDELNSEDIPVGDVGNVAGTATSRVLFTPGNDEAARFVAEHLGDLPAEPDPALSGGRISVVLGSDYDGPGAQHFAVAPRLRLDGAVRQSPGRPNGDTITAGGIPCVN